MTNCPRCSAANDAGRAACWNCYAPLQGTQASRVKPMVLTGHGGAVELAPAEPAAEPAGAPAPKKRGLFGRK